MIKNIKIFILHILLIGCVDSRNVDQFLLTQDLIDNVSLNNNCQKILNEKLGFSNLPNFDKSHSQILLSNFYRNQNNVKGNSFAFLNIISGGETKESLEFFITEQKSKTTVVNYDRKSNNLKNATIEISNYDLSVLRQNLKKLEEPKKGTKIKALLINFSNNQTCNCFFYENINGNGYNSIGDLTFFDN